RSDTSVKSNRPDRLDSKTTNTRTVSPSTHSRRRRSSPLTHPVKPWLRPFRLESFLMTKNGRKKEKHKMADASIKIDGRIANDVRFNSVNGKSVANIKVLAGRSKKNDDGTWENITTTAYDVAFW